ncbi:MAG: hypothetical protein U1C96_11420 [Gallionella sp.]|nr:hypothetical protein [Gallionella sp.]
MTTSPALLVAPAPGLRLPHPQGVGRRVPRCFAATRSHWRDRYSSMAMVAGTQLGNLDAALHAVAAWIRKKLG